MFIKKTEPKSFWRRTVKDKTTVTNCKEDNTGKKRRKVTSKEVKN